MHLGHLMEQDTSLQLQALGCQVVVVAQGTRESGVQWKKNNSLPFTLLIDRDMKFYRLFGLRQEVKLAWNLDIFNFYAAQIIEGRKDNIPYDGDDFTVMGGDFIVKQNGDVLFAHSQKELFDWPKVADLLQCLRS